jgi:hypothetical protein
MSSTPEKEDLPTSSASKQPPVSQPQRRGFDLPKIVKQLEDLVNLALACEKKDLLPNVSFVEVHKKLLKIRQQTDLFQENFRKQLAKLNLREEDIRLTPEALAKMPAKDKQIFEKLQKLQSTCEEARDRIRDSLKKDQAAVLSVKEELKDKSTSKTRRKSKFKGVGGKQGWIPT